MSLPEQKQEAGMTFTLPELPFAKTALQPYMSPDTLDFHHGKHHAAYVNKANELVQGTDLEGKSLEDAVKAAREQGVGPLFNNVAQHFNHSFFWNSLMPNGGGEPVGALAEKINEDFGSFDTFKQEFINAGAGQFGSGWVWLVLNDGKLEIVKTPNAETPLTDGKTPLLTCDVWEHAYYLDFQNRRPDFLATFLDHLVNWDFAGKNFDDAQ